MRQEHDGQDAVLAAAVTAALGAERYRALLVLLAERLQGLAVDCAGWSVGEDLLSSRLHQYRGSASTLGLSGVAAALAELQAQLRGNPATHGADLAGVLTAQAGAAREAAARAGAAAVHHPSPAAAENDNPAP